MSDRKSMDKQEFQDKILETEQAISYDRQCREHDAKEYHKKHHYLMQYRDGNKQVTLREFLIVSLSINTLVVS